MVRIKSSKDQSLTFHKIVLNQFQKNWLHVTVLAIIITITGILTGALTAETFRRITQAILDKSLTAFWQSMLFLAVVISVNFISSILSKIHSFNLIRKTTIFCEDRLYEKYKEQTYWLNADDALGQIRKNVPSTVDLCINLICSTYQTAIVIISGCIYAITLNYIVLLASIGITGIMLVFSYRALKSLNNLYKEFGICQGKLYNRLWEQIQNREIARFLIPERVSEPYLKESRSFLNIVLRSKKISNSAELFSSFGSTIMIILVSLIGGTYVLKNMLTMAELLALIIVIPTISSNLFGIPNVIASWKSVIGQSKPISDFLKEDVKKNGKQEILRNDIEKISINDLEFGYNQNEKVLKDVSLQFSCGYYAIAGMSGCGKTTFMKILAKLLPYEKGDISINEQQLHKIDRQNYWQHISYASQDPVILIDTLLYNITMSDHDYDEERLYAAIKDAQLEDFLFEQSEGLKTIISPDTISKGEGQRISIARIFYRNTKVLLLDEITSGLDPQSEIKVVEALKRRAKKENQIVLCISHRLQPLSISDEVIFFKDGGIDARGKHEILLETNDSYKIMLKAVSE